MILFNKEIPYVFGGYNKDRKIRFDSTSGGAFSAIVEAYCDNNYVIFGATGDGLHVYHTFITDKKNLSQFRKSKYMQSKMGNSFKEVKKFLSEGKKVVFSGTPCQVAGLKMFLKNMDVSGLLTVEVVCEGVPSPLYIRKYKDKLEKKYSKKIESIVYRDTGKNIFKHGKWDFEAMKIKFENSNHEIIIDRWFNPFWSIWLSHLMSRPACYECPFARNERTADITLGDLWGVHLYCPELYGSNGGSSVVFANTLKGRKIVLQSQKYMDGHELKVEDAIRYQSPMRKHIESNPKRKEFMRDLQSSMDYDEIVKKWDGGSSFKLLWQKYVWGNRQKIWLWKLTKGKYRIK